MKIGLLLSALLICVILICGCASQSETQTVSSQLDPIVGVWTQDLTTSSDVSPLIYTYTFFENGDFSWDDTHSSSGSVEGQWIKIRENQYVISYKFSEDTETFIYNPTTDTLSQPEYPSLTIFRAGKMPAPTIKAATASITSVTQSSNRYEQGDEIQRLTTDSAYDKDRAWVILKVNYDEEKYTVGNLYYDPGARKWYKMDDELPQLRFFSALERDCPVLLGKIEWDTVPVKYRFKNCDGDIILSYDPKPPDCSSTDVSEGTLSGYGDDVIKISVVDSGLYIFTMTYSGKHNFIVWLKDSEGYTEELLANEIGAYSGRTSARLEPGVHVLDIQASGPWKIQIS